MDTYWAGILNSRTNRRRVLRASIGASTIAAALSLIGCGGGGDSGAKKDTSGLLFTPTDTSKAAVKGGVLARTGSSRGFDVTRGGVESADAGTAYSRLVRYQTYKYPDKPLSEVVPDAALSWEVAGDGLSYT